MLNLLDSSSDEERNGERALPPRADADADAAAHAAPAAVVATFKDPGPLGLEFAPRKDGGGVLVFKVHARSRAAACRPPIRRGMRLAACNGSAARAARVSVDRVGELIREAGFPLTLTFHPAPRAKHGARHAALLARIQRRFRWRRRRRREAQLAKTAEVEAALEQAAKPAALGPHAADNDRDDATRVDPLLLLTACQEGRAGDVRRLVSSDAAAFVDPNAAVGGCTPLFVACQYGRTEVVRTLLDSGHTIDAGGYCCFVEPESSNSESDASGRSGSDGERKYAAARKPKRPAVARKPATIQSHSATPLLVAAAGGHAQIVEMLLARPDVDVNATSAARRGGATALYMASQNGHAGVVSLLLHAEGVKIEARSGPTGPPGVTPIDIATHRKHKAVAALIEARQAELAADAARRLKEATCKTCGVDRRVEPRCPCTRAGWLDRRAARVVRARSAVSPLLTGPVLAGPHGRRKRVVGGLPPLRRTPSMLRGKTEKMGTAP